HLSIHWKKAKALGRPFLEAAIVIGGPPCIGLVSVSKLPYELSEYDVAGGIAGAPIPLVKCQTVDLEVPAAAEFVLEGIMPTDFVEEEGAFGEYTGYMGLRTSSPCFKINCITRRKKPIYHAFISQFPPSESSTLKRIAQESYLYKFLKHDCNIPGILEVALHEPSGTNAVLIIRLKKVNPNQPWQALNTAAGCPEVGKIIIVVDEDIDPKDPDTVLWAMSYRMQPHLDTRVSPGKILGLDPSAFPPDSFSSGDFVVLPPRIDTSMLLIDATRKWDYPPIALPKKEYMEHAMDMWKELGLPKLNPKTPWYGYSLGQWTRENEEEADLALKGEHFTTGERQETRRTKV
ncbi:MAG: UbiD family decarboxylase, partial [bacterium]|nr:UbiD family decarboxylase [bacterium]